MQRITRRLEYQPRREYREEPQTLAVDEATAEPCPSDGKGGQGHPAFDPIVSGPPFRCFKPRDLTETAITDEGYRAMTSFFRQA